MKSKLLLNSLPRYQNSAVYAALTCAMPSICVSSLSEVPDNVERKAATDQMARKVGFGARPPSCTSGPQEFLAG